MAERCSKIVAINNLIMTIFKDKTLLITGGIGSYGVMPYYAGSLILISKKFVFSAVMKKTG